MGTFGLTCHLGPREPLADDLTHGQVKAVSVVHVAAIVVAKRLLIQVTEQMDTAQRSRRYR